MKYILSRLKALESIQPSIVYVHYTNGEIIEVDALKAFNMAVNCPEVVSFVSDR